MKVGRGEGKEIFVEVDKIYISEVFGCMDGGENVCIDG